MAPKKLPFFAIFQVRPTHQLIFQGTDNMENGLAPWIGYQDEESMKAKILALSQDKRNFVRAPPAGVSFEFDYGSVSATAMALLQEDPQLDAMRYFLTSF